MKALLLISALLLSFAVFADDVGQSAAVSNEYSSQQEAKQQEFTEEAQRLATEFNSYSMFSVNRAWQQSLDTFQDQFVDNVAKKQIDSDGDGTFDRVVADARSENAAQFDQASRREVVEHYNSRRESALALMDATAQQIENLENNAAYDLMAKKNPDLANQIAAIKTQIASQRQSWPEVGFFDSKDKVLSVLSGAEESIYPMAGLAENAMDTWKTLEQTYATDINAARDAADQKLTEHLSTQGDINKNAFALALQNNMQTTRMIEGQSRTINNLKSDLLLRDIEDWAADMKMDVGEFKKLLLNDETLNHAMAKTPMGIYVNRQISRAMAGICNEVAQCTEDAKSAEKAFTDMFKFLDDSSRGSNAVDAIPDDYEIDEAVIKN